MPTTASEDIRTRVLASAKSASRAHKVVTAHALRLLNVANELTADGATHRANRHLSDAGKRAKMMDSADKVSRQFVLSQIGIAHAKAARKPMVDELATKALEPFRGDAMSAEIRAAIKPLTQADKIKLAENDPRILAALVEVPPIVHGMPQATVQALIQGYLEKNHTEEWEKAGDQDKAADEVFACAEAAIQIAQSTLWNNCEFTSSEAFRRWRDDESRYPSAAQMVAETTGKAAPGTPAWSAIESFDLLMDDSLNGLPK